MHQPEPPPPIMPPQLWHKRQMDGVLLGWSPSHMKALPFAVPWCACMERCINTAPSCPTSDQEQFSEWLSAGAEDGFIHHRTGTALASFSGRWCCRVQMSLHTRLWCCRAHILKYERPERPSLPLWCTQSACGKRSVSSVRYFRGQPVERGSWYVAWKQLLAHPGCASFYLFALRGSYLTLLPNLKG